jgi:hypothetical protein
MKEENFSPEQSLQLIRSMIGKSQQDMSDNSIYFMVWGWLTFIACTAEFILKHIYQYEQHYLVWLLLVPAIIFTIYQGGQERKKQKISTYINDSMKWLWVGMGIGFFVLGMILSGLGWENSYFPFFILLYGLGTFVSGSILRFRPLVLGGIVAWVLAIGAAYAEDDYQMLFASAAILFSYIIPAYLLKRKQKYSPA